MQYYSDHAQVKIGSSLLSIIRYLDDSVPLIHGINFENDTFTMRKFCWCGSTRCSQCNGVPADVPIKQGVDMETRYSQSGRAPTFIYKPTGAHVYWHKYLTNTIEIDGELPKDFYEACLDSIGVYVPNTTKPYGQ